MFAFSDQKYLLAHPFFLLTTTFSTASWIIALISQAFTTTKYGRSAVATLWLAILLQLLVNVGVLYGLCTNSIHIFRLQISVFASMSVVLGALGIDNNVFSGFGSRDAVAAAWFIILIIDLLWILVLSSERDSPVLQVFTEDTRIRLSSELHSLIEREIESQTHSSTNDTPLPETKELLSNPRNTTLSAPETHQSDHTARPALPLFNSRTTVYEGSKATSNKHSGSLMNDRQSVKSRLTVPTSTATHGSSNAPSSNYSYTQKALALYDYTVSNSTAEADDTGEGELSFARGDILEVSRTFEKKWWPARKSNGQVGVVPSNYLKVIPG
ncbi:hypothetical protein J3R30DRAFT_3477719 [Lentinula aciculospora]|uniref:SH3 domain-containing protein n=1 Tax=Lentinula aciculospora TaxID=153920 RepID=A0A9W9DNN5_9AGAR|nr:hypothetical protein J3R30DRAFT_3477719 [Lentinula aciculospora]